jgi:hypothetical protein
MPAIKCWSLISVSYHLIAERPGVWSVLRINLGTSLLKKMAY